MRPAEIVTAVVSIPVVALFLMSASADRQEPPAPTAVAAQAPAPFTHIDDEIVVIAKRAAASAAPR